MSDDFIVTMKDVRAVHMCSGKSRDFAERHNLDWMDFLKNGIPASKLLATGDALAIQIVEAARGKQ